MTRALLGLLIPADSIDYCARQIASSNQKGGETVASYAMRYPTLIGQFPSAVDRAADNRTTWSAMMIALSQHGFKPSVRWLQLIDKTCTTMKEAIERARCHEASGLAGGHVMALFNHVPHSALDRTPEKNRPLSRIVRLTSGVEVGRRPTSAPPVARRQTTTPRFVPTPRAAASRVTRHSNAEHALVRSV